MKSRTGAIVVVIVLALAAVGVFVVGRGLSPVARSATSTAPPVPGDMTPVAPTPTSTPVVAASPTPSKPTATATAAAAQPTLAAATATPVRPPTPGPTVAPDLALEFTRVRPNQFLSNIAFAYGVAVDDIVAYSGLENPDLLMPGQGLIIPHRTERYTPAQKILPDSETVYGPAYRDFDVAAFVERQGGYLATFTMPANGGRWTGADVVERVATRFSVGPRVLLALLEARSGWVTEPEPDSIARDYPAGHLQGAPGLLPQLEWAADELGRGFYGWLDRGETAVRYQDGVVARGEPALNAASVAVQRVLAADSSWPDAAAEQQAFLDAYERLFGDPWALDAGPVLPAGLEQPPLLLPWPAGDWWYLTGGPHGGWGSGSGWAALDFVPEAAGIGTCLPADAWALAVAPGLVVRNDNGEVLVDLDDDGDLRSGWVIQYLHVAEAVPAGTELATGDPVGRPSCVGGAAESTHLHIARRYNGLWVAADGPLPFVMEGWKPYGSFEYEGGLTKAGSVPREACDCRDREINGLVAGAEN